MLLYILTGGITVLTVGLRISSLARTVFCAVLLMLLAPLSEIFFSASAAALLALLCRKSA